MKKKNHMIPSEREKDCVYHHFRYTGAIPCTGRYVCSMCGLEIPRKWTGYVYESVTRKQVKKHLLEIGDPGAAVM